MEACKVRDHNHSEEMLYIKHRHEPNSNSNHKHYVHGLPDNENSNYIGYGTYDFSIVPDGTHDHFHHLEK
jgi:hypothetical protein